MDADILARHGRRQLLAVEVPVLAEDDLAELLAGGDHLDDKRAGGALPLASSSQPSSEPLFVSFLLCFRLNAVRAPARTEIETRLEPPRNPPVAAFPDWRVSVLRLAGFGSCTGGY